MFARSASATSPAARTLSANDATWLVVGLGNPGAKYAATRHNVGYMALDHLLAENETHLEPVPGVKANVAVAGDVAYLRSTTYMNLSGEGVAPVARLLGIEPDHIIVIHDELDLPPGQVRLKLGGNENGHNGLKSITEQVGTRDYIRVRVGIGRPTDRQPIPEWVLGVVESSPELDEQIHLAAEATQLITKEGLSKAQNQVHSRGRR
ncbi:aminoacyl-tRNA hydrolase [Corynebacterium breve]|uniref:Peptidyl-tRNA hydrolase n=1 Tax=Corynebacterium breve TaxID=3049799 RepID=A0ABY8VIX1_9CORY|nr:aminoacyl-tRNA hydrolase [Corynebacterium breve]WIM69002.1 aminoacyl-tRNA hydrolase [Corynebacterium breve]